MRNFWVKSTKILKCFGYKNFLYLFNNKIIYNFIFVAKKMVGEKKFIPLLFWCCCWIRDPGWIKIGIRDKHPGSATRHMILGKSGFPGQGLRKIKLERD
jgi:hypothetical protein